MDTAPMLLKFSRKKFVYELKPTSLDDSIKMKSFGDKGKKDGVFWWECTKIGVKR